MRNPERGGIAQSEQRERGHAGVQVTAELAAAHALLDHALDDALIAQLAGADSPASGLRQKAPLPQEHQT